MLMPIFESVPRGRKPNEKQGSKACQEDQRAREVQRNKCKGKGSAVEYKSAAEYKSTAEYSFLAEWLRQTKTIGPKTLLIQSTLSGPQGPKFFCIKG